MSVCNTLATTPSPLYPFSPLPPTPLFNPLLERDPDLEEALDHDDDEMFEAQDSFFVFLGPKQTELNKRIRL